ncbi:MAG: hypothetical protein WAW85_16820 [Gordonia sp. (in: high G+C Gram-positive bacteria)]|uniref:hypothetical protein n=1 Tax=Gordonia sp. (in: high G+C Gram-positive bacteria) TaxID=84139 RepID=UPI003BB48A23
MKVKARRAPQRKNTLQLPSICRALSISNQESSGGQRFAVISDGQFHTVILRCALDGRAPAGQISAQWVQFWDDRIGVDDANADLVAITTVLDFVPASVDDFARWCDSYLYAADSGPLSPVGLVSLTFRMRSGREADDAAAVVLGVRLPAIMRSLQQAGLPLVPLVRSDVVAHLASVYAPRSRDTADEWADLVPDRTEETRHYVMHPDHSKTVSWVFSSRILADQERSAIEAMGSPRLYRRRLAMAYRRTREGERSVLQRQIMAMSAVIPSGHEPHTGELMGENTDNEQPVAVRLAMRRAYDRQGELMALTSGVGVVLPEHAEIGEHPVLADGLSRALEAS